MAFVRYGIPAGCLAAALIILALEPNGDGATGAAGFGGAGLAVFLLNLLFRVGVKGDEERQVEDAAREYFDVHGEWPSEEEHSPGRKWNLAPGTVTWEMEQAEFARRERERD